MFDARDLAIQQTCPVMGMPRFGALPEGDFGQRMLLGSNGLFMQMRTPWLECTTRIGAVPRGLALPFGAVREWVRFAFGTIPVKLLIEFIAEARLAMPLEVAGAIVFNVTTGALDLRLHRSVAATGARVDYEVAPLADDEAVVVDIHSHGLHRAHWSPTDDEDDQGVKVCAVFGNLDREHVSARFRLAINGHFVNLASPWEGVDPPR